jgi:hypothetical protein
MDQHHPCSFGYRSNISFSKPVLMMGIYTAKGYMLFLRCTDVFELFAVKNDIVRMVFFDGLLEAGSMKFKIILSLYGF